MHTEKDGRAITEATDSALAEEAPEQGAPDSGDPARELLGTEIDRRRFLKHAALATSVGALMLLPELAVARGTHAPLKAIDPSIFDPRLWPLDSFPSLLDPAAVLSALGINPNAAPADDTDFTLHIPDPNPLAVSLPGLSGFTVTLGAANSDLTCQVNRSTHLLSVKTNNLPVRIELDRALFQPMVAGGGTYTPDPAPGAVVAASFTLSNDLPGGFSLQVGLDGTLRMGSAGSIDLSPANIGGSGFVLEAHGLKLDALGPTKSDGSPRLPAERGIDIASATVAFLPLKGITLTATNLHIGGGGFSGTISADTAATPSVTLLGFTVKLTNLSAEFKQNALISTSIEGTLRLPFFDVDLDVVVSFNLSGDISITAKTIGGDGYTHVPVLGLFELRLGTFSFTESGGKTQMKMDLKLRPTFTLPSPFDTLIGPLPEIDLGGLLFDTSGNVDPDGGTADQGEAKHLSLAGFDFEVDQIGLGLDPARGYKYIVFKGAVRLPEGLPAGVSVDGLRIYFDKTGVKDASLGGIGVDTEIADVLKLKGSLEFTKKGFTGEIDVTIEALDLNAKGSLAVSNDPNGWAVALDVELPTGIPLGPSGLAIYGFQGLFGYNYVPDRHPDESWYKGTNAQPLVDSTQGWYSRSPSKDVTNVAKKWRPQAHSFAFGLGVTLGTAVDDAQAVAARIALIVSVPGPVLILVGGAQVLGGRDALDDPPFSLLMVLDGNANTYQLDIGAHLPIPKDDSSPDINGLLLDIEGDAEAFFDGNHPDRWHLYLGQQPRPLRLSASTLHLYHSEAYFMLTNDNVRFGVWIGYEDNWDFGPFSASIAAYIEGDALVSWKPVQLAGSIHLHGGLALSVFGIGFSLSADATLCLAAPHPYLVDAGIAVHLGLPWPLPDIDASFHLHWHTPDDLPDPTTSDHNPVSAMALRHPLTVESVPAVDGSGKPAGPQGTSAADAPTVAVDWRPVITFKKDMNNKLAALPTVDLLADSGLVAIEQGDPTSLGVPNCPDVPQPAWRYDLTGITLEESPDTEANLKPYTGPVHATWLAVQGRTAGAPGRRVLSFYTRNPYDYTRNNSSTKYAGWFNEAYPDYPCRLPVPEGGFTQCVFLQQTSEAGFPAGLTLGFRSEPFGVEGFVFRPSSTVAIVPGTANGTYYAADGLHYNSALRIDLPTVGDRATAQTLNNKLDGTGPFTLTAYYKGVEVDSQAATLAGNYFGASVSAPLIDQILIGQTQVIKGFKVLNPAARSAGTRAALASRRVLTHRVNTRSRDVAGPGGTGTTVGGTILTSVCYTDALHDGIITSLDDAQAYMGSHTATDSKKWKDSGNVFNPNKLYKLSVTATATVFKDAGKCRANDPTAEQRQGTFTNVFFFRTAHGPDQPGGLVPYVEKRLKVARRPGDPPPVVLPGVPDTADLSGWTIPANGAKAAFRAYDLGVRFRVDWVAQMYGGVHTPLAYDVIDINGNPATDAKGNPIAEQFVQAPEHLLSTEERTWFEHVQSCGDYVKTTEIATDSIFTIKGNGPDPIQLLPNMFYTVRLMQESLGGGVSLYSYRSTKVGAQVVFQSYTFTGNILYSYSFNTSSFLTFADMINSFSGSPAPGKVWAETRTVSDAQIADITTRVNSVAGGAARNTESAAFDSIAGQLNHATRAWPARTEVTVFTRVPPGGGTHQVIALLLETPQPLDWERTDIILKRRRPFLGGILRTLPTPFTMVRNFDNTRAWLFAPGGTSASAVQPFPLVNTNQYTIALTYKRTLGVAGKPVYSVGGDTSPETATLEFNVTAS